MKCSGGSGRRLMSTSARLCADKDLVMNEPLNTTIARLTGTFCDPEIGGDVGASFAGQILDSLDANNNGEVDCAEWGIAKKFATLETLGGGYFGPKKIWPPACKLSKEGAQELAAYNAYLAELTLLTIKVNATGLAKTSVINAAHTVDGVVRSNALVGKVEGAVAQLSAKLNGTLSG